MHLQLSHFSEESVEAAVLSGGGQGADAGRGAGGRSARGGRRRHRHHVRLQLATRLQPVSHVARHLVVRTYRIITLVSGRDLVCGLRDGLGEKCIKCGKSTVLISNRHDVVSLRPPLDTSG